MHEVSKRYPGVLAVDRVSLTVLPAEVHVVVGENGAGKSTLMKVLAGIYAKDGGHIYYKGKEVEINGPKAAQQLGISIIHQELNLMPHLTVAQNIFIGREPRKGLNFFLDDKDINTQALKLFENLRIKIDPTTKVADLTVAMQQMVEIAKALSIGFEVLIMDEPTAALTESEITELFRIIRELRDRGVGIVYISHRLEEIKQISDRVTVMRDGHYIDTVNTADVTIDRIINMMVGRTIYEGAPELPENASKEVVLEVQHLNRGRQVRDVSFKLYKGEILGFAGLVGAGRTEVARAIFGADKPESGTVLIHGKPVRIRSPKDAVKAGIAYLSEDRKRYGLALGLDVETNVVLATFQEFLRLLGWVDTGKTRQTADRYVKALAIKTPSISQRVKNLSGGNQQKVIIGKWLTADTEILIFDEPTRGIDVGAKSEIYHLLNELATQGKAIIMISSELPEILRMSHRIAVMCEGRLTGILSSHEATQEKIMALATQRGDLAGPDAAAPPVPAAAG